MPGTNVSEERLLELCSEFKFYTGNTYFRKKGINQFTWQRIDNERLVVRAMMDYVLVEKNVQGRLVDVHVSWGAGRGVSENFLVVVKVKGRVGFRRKMEQVQCREKIKSSELSKRVKEQEYEEKVRMAYERIEHQEIMIVEEEWKEFRDAVLEYATEVYGCRREGQWIRKRSEW